MSRLMEDVEISVIMSGGVLGDNSYDKKLRRVLREGHRTWRMTDDFFSHEFT